VTFEEQCKLAIDNGKPGFKRWDQCDNKGKSLRINAMFNDIAIKKSTQETLKRLYP
tara:strand:+ start:664 stop:831 length:168 start_codon:yes stop_codon:yes gene_type:complete